MFSYGLLKILKWPPFMPLQTFSFPPPTPAELLNETRPTTKTHFCFHTVCPVRHSVTLTNRLPHPAKHAVHPTMTAASLE